MRKGSACVEVFRYVAHQVATFFGDPDRARRSKEMSFQHDMRVLVEDMEGQRIHKGFKKHFVPQILKPTSKKQPESAIIDVQVTGAEIWMSGKWRDFITLTTYDRNVGYPIGYFNDEVDHRLDSETVFDNPGDIHLSRDSDLDVFGDENELGFGSLGGGGEFDSGVQGI